MTKITLSTYIASLKEPLQQATLCFLMQDTQILLGRKKRGLGQGKWLGIGGKKEAGENIEETAIRETQEEIGVTPTNIRQVAILNFYFPYVEKPAQWSQQVYVFIARQWVGTIEESAEIAPQWFEISTLPFEAMWPDARLWLPKVLAGAVFEGHFLYGVGMGIEDFALKVQGT